MPITHITTAEATDILKGKTVYKDNIAIKLLNVHFTEIRVNTALIVELTKEEAQELVNVGEVYSSVRTIIAS